VSNYKNKLYVNIEAERVADIVETYAKKSGALAPVRLLIQNKTQTKKVIYTPVQCSKI